MAVCYLKIKLINISNKRMSDIKDERLRCYYLARYHLKGFLKIFGKNVEILHLFKDIIICESMSI